MKVKVDAEVKEKPVKKLLVLRRFFNLHYERAKVEPTVAVGIILYGSEAMSLQVEGDDPRAVAGVLYQVAQKVLQQARFLDAEGKPTELKTDLELNAETAVEITGRPIVPAVALTP